MVAQLAACSILPAGNWLVKVMHRTFAKVLELEYPGYLSWVILKRYLGRS
jgi:hypothetical protein